MAARIRFEQELEQLKQRVAQMGECVQISYEKLCLAVKGNDREGLEQLLDRGRAIADTQRSIEAGCLALMTKQQPIARDLRLVSAALKVVSDIERAGDHVGDMAELFLRRNPPFAGEGDGPLQEMLQEAGALFQKAVAAFTEGDVDNARRVIEGDDTVDGLFNRVKEEMMEAIRGQLLDADRVVDDLMIAKYLEKVGDHAVNIGQWAIFRVTGDMEGAFSS